MIEFVDTHTHLFVHEFDEDREAAVQRAIDAGVGKLCLPCITTDSIAPIAAMCEKHPGVCYAMAGLHPTEIGDDYKEQLATIKSHLKENKNIIAVGEVGIDLYWDTSRRNEQIEVFETQIAWARELSLPLCIHSRNAFDDLHACMQRCGCNELTGVFHCFSGTKEQACELMKMEGFMFGIGGVVTYKKSDLPEVLSCVPLERIVLETDSPYLAPVPRRGKRNESSYIPYIATRIAEIYDTTVENVARVTTDNAYRLFAALNSNI